MLAIRSDEARPREGLKEVIGMVEVGESRCFRTVIT
jgi:hypothetical protein